MVLHTNKSKYDFREVDVLKHLLYDVPFVCWKSMIVNSETDRRYQKYLVAIGHPLNWS